jgi:hypothetical protein
MKCDDFPAIIANKDPSATCDDTSPNVSPANEDYPKENPHTVIHYFSSGRIEADMHFYVVMAWIATNPADCQHYTSRRLVHPPHIKSKRYLPLEELATDMKSTLCLTKNFLADACGSLGCCTSAVVMRLPASGLSGLTRWRMKMDRVGGLTGS